MMLDYQLTPLWTTAFSDAGLRTDSQRTARDDLLSALRALESRVTPLLGKIDESCHELTIHDISHVHQLWSVASEVCGPDYPLNPLEGFVLGAAFLIHDAGLTAAAYPGGLPALENTVYYKDRVAALLRTVGNELPLRNHWRIPQPRFASAHFSIRLGLFTPSEPKLCWNTSSLIPSPDNHIGSCLIPIYSLIVAL